MSNGFFAQVVSSSVEPPSRATWSVECPCENEETARQACTYSQPLVIRCSDGKRTEVFDVCSTTALHAREGRLTVADSTEVTQGRLCTTTVKAAAEDILFAFVRKLATSLRLSEPVEGSLPLQAWNSKMVRGCTVKVVGRRWLRFGVAN